MQNYIKAIGGGIAALVVGYAAQPTVNLSLHTLWTALLSYAFGHLVVYLFPANKPVDVQANQG